MSTGSSDAIRVSGAPSPAELAAVLAALRTADRDARSSPYERWRRLRLAVLDTGPRR